MTGKPLDTVRAFFSTTLECLRTDALPKIGENSQLESDQTEDAKHTHVPTTVYGIQALRAVAAILVVIRHTCLWSVQNGATGSSFPIGPIGVDLFFAISGFVMYMTAPLSSPASFMKKRFARIAPLYWSVMVTKLLIVIVAALMGSKIQFSTWNFICSAFFLPSFNIDKELAPFIFAGWTLNFEMFFYLVCGLCLLCSRRLFFPLVCIFISLNVVLGMCLSQSGIGYDRFPMLVLTSDICLEFVFGMFAAHLWMHGPKLSTFTCIVLLILPSMIWLYYAPYAAPYTPLRSVTWGIPAATLLLAVLHFENKIDIKNFRLAALLGNASYSIYLIHTMVIPIIGKALRTLLGINYWIEVPIIVFTSCFVGTVTYVLFEKKLLRFASHCLSIQRLR